MKGNRRQLRSTVRHFPEVPFGKTISSLIWINARARHVAEILAHFSGRIIPPNDPRRDDDDRRSEHQRRAEGEDPPYETCACGGKLDTNRDMFQAAVYSFYPCQCGLCLGRARLRLASLDDDWYVTAPGTDHLTADFSANNVGGRIEGGYRFAIPGVLAAGSVRDHPLRRWAGAGLPHAVLQRKRRIRLVDLRACLQCAHDDHGPQRARRLARLEHPGRRRHPGAARPRRLGTRLLVRDEHHGHVPRRCPDRASR